MAVPPPAYVPTHYPWHDSIAGTSTPLLRQPQIGRLTSVLIHLTNGHDYPPFSFLPDVLSAFSSRETRPETGIWAYFHPVEVIPRLDEIRDLALPAPEIKYPKQISDDLVRPWVPIAQSNVRNETTNDHHPRYRLLIFIHRFLYPDVDAGYNSPYEVFAFTVWDRETDSVRFYDFWEEDLTTRQIAIFAYWARVQISYKDIDPAIVPTPLYPMLVRGLTATGDQYESLATIMAQMRTKHPSPRVTIYATFGMILDILNRIDEPGVLIPEDTPDVLSGLRTDLIPSLFDEVLNILRAQPFNLAAIPPHTIEFTSSLPRSMHAVLHTGQPFLDRAWIARGLHIPNYPINRLLRQRLRTRLRTRVQNNTMPGWYPLEILHPRT